jgi:hypothetical protein
MTTESARCQSVGRVWRAAEMPRCGTWDVLFAPSFEDEKELPVPRCSAAQAHLTVASAASEAKSAASWVRPQRRGETHGLTKTAD